jgi:septum formation protein
MKLGFEIDPSNYEEDMGLEMEPSELAKHLSLGKAKDVAKRHENSIIIAADTFCVFGKEILGKPHSKENARKMLKMLSGNVHSVITGLTIIDTETDKQISRAVESKVYFKNIPDDEIERYVESGDSLEKAGAYAMQERGGIFVERIEGDYFNIVGLPVAPLFEELKNFGFNILEK